MKATLVAYSKPVGAIHTGERGYKGLDNIQDLVAYCARVSNPGNQANTKTTPKLLKYLIKHKHWSPFEMASATIEVETTRDIGRQLLRHRSFSFQEFSQRYADVRDLDGELVIRKARLQDPKNRQNSVITDDTNLHIAWEQHQRNVWSTAMTAYEWAIQNGIAKEQARVVLPEGNTASRLYVNGTIRSWIHYVELRSANGTQLEHIQLAQEIAKAINQIFNLELTDD